MEKTRPDIVISGAGVACAVGTGCEAFAAALFGGRDGLRPVTRFSVAEFDTKVAGLWPAWDGTEAEKCGAVELGTVSAREAWKNARGDEAKVDPARIAVVLGTCFGDAFVRFSELTEDIARSIGARGPCLTVSTACSSSTSAIGIARDLIEEDNADLVLAGGVDVLTREVFAGFHALGALSAGKCAPFSETLGTSLSEGAGFVVLERRGLREARPLAHVLGYGLSADAHHETAPDPSGSGLIRAISGALRDADLAPSAIDAVSAHGTGTGSNDGVEWLALRSALGPSAEKTPVTALKSYLGHAQGAAGVLELIGMLLCAERNAIPPSLRSEPPRPGAPTDPVCGEKPRQQAATHMLKLSAAFGGANSALVVSRATPAPRKARPRRKVSVAGLSALGPFGVDVASLEAAVSARKRRDGAAADFDLGRIVRSAPSRDIDPSGRFAAAAAALALSDAKLSIKGELRARTGLFTGNSRMPAASAEACRVSIDQRGIRGVAAVPFSHMVLNAPAGTAAKLLSLKGPLLVLSAGSGSGLLAIIRAAEHLASRDDADILLAGGLDELPVRSKDGLAEGAAFAALTTGETGVALEGWGLSGPASVNDAISAALRGVPEVDGVYGAGDVRDATDPSRYPLGFINVDESVGGAESTASAYALVAAASAIRRGIARKLLVVSRGSSVSCAAVISRGRA